MAKVYAAPAGYEPPEPDFKNYNPEAEQRKERAYIERLSKWCKENCPPSGKGDLVGEVIATGRGDGYAFYMICQQKPLHLIHVEIGDCWRADPIWERGLGTRDARALVERRKNPLFGSS